MNDWSFSQSSEQLVWKMNCWTVFQIFVAASSKILNLVDCSGLLVIVLREQESLRGEYLGRWNQKLVVHSYYRLGLLRHVRECHEWDYILMNFLTWTWFIWSCCINALKVILRIIKMIQNFSWFPILIYSKIGSLSITLHIKIFIDDSKIFRLSSVVKHWDLKSSAWFHFERARAQEIVNILLRQFLRGRRQLL